MKLKRLYIIVFAILFAFDYSFAKDNFISEKLYSSPKSKKMFEIGEVRFEGNSNFESDLLTQFIGLKPTIKSFPHKVFQTLRNEFGKKMSKDSKLITELQKSVDNFKNEIKYFDETSAENDVLSLWHFYNTNGFHYAEVNYSFVPDTNSRKNILTFHIIENKRYKLAAIQYFGLDSLPDNLAERIEAHMRIRPGNYFSEDKIISEVNKIFDDLQNNGYYYSYYQQPEVTMDTINLEDSVSIRFFLGERVKISSIAFIDSTKGQPSVINDLKRKQLDFKVGDWYSRQKVSNSVDNLLTLGTFENVSIDTIRAKHDNPNSISFSILSEYRKQREWGVGLFTNHSQLTNYNAGAEASIFHRNLFGMAQSASLSLSGSFKDIGRIITDPSSMEYEISAAVKYAQPLLWTIDNTKIGLATSLGFSIRMAYTFFQINTLSFPIKFPIKLPNATYFNTMNVEFNFEREEPIGFTKAISKAFSNIKNSTDSTRIYEALTLYTNLWNYLSDKNVDYIWTSNTIGFNLIGDNKNNPFNPTKGNYTFIGFDGWNIFLAHPKISGISRYFRFQFAHHQFFPINPTLTIALKGRFGGIYLIDDANSYVPIERQFYAGGANSVRGWGARQLRYTKVLQDSTLSGSGYKFLQNFVGNGGIVEGSAEFRFKFKRPRGLSETLAEQIGNLGVTFFVDFGNAFHWLTPIEKTKVKFTDYFTKLAVAGGLGLRYDTPVGPLRGDFAWPLYDPLNQKQITWSNFNFHFGIGHAF